MNDLTRWIGEFPWAKLAYSAILVALILVFVTELRRLWWDSRVYVGKFQVFVGSEEQKAQATAFAVQLINHHRTLSHLFADEEKRRAEAQKPTSGAASPQRQESTWWPREVVAVNDPRSALSDLELSVQGVNVKEILTKLRQWISAPNEISGLVDVGTGGVRTTVTWPRGPSKRRGALVDAELLTIETQPDSSSAAFQVACSVVWAQAASQQENLAAVSRTDFCNWTQAWVRYLEIRDKSATVQGLIAEDIQQLMQLRAYLDRVTVQAQPYPEVFRLRADIIDLLPVSEKTPADIAADIEQAQQDRTRYAIATDPVKSALPLEIAQYQVLAEARPAIEVAGTELLGEISPTWWAVLTSYKTSIMSAARATGYGRIVRKGKQDNGGYFCGFVVAPNLVLSRGWVVQEYGPFPATFSEDDEAWFAFGNSARNLDAPEDVTRIEEVIFRTDELALIRISHHDVNAHPPLPLELSLSSNESLKGRYVFVVGYPAYDGRVPEAFQKALFGENDRVKRVMPGRIVSVSMDKDLRRITSDLSTTGGTAGGPLVDLVTGRVLAIHAAGIWRGGQGKIAFSPALEDVLTTQGIRERVGPLLNLPELSELESIVKLLTPQPVE